MNRNNRGDLLVKGIVKPDAEIEVLFAGQRLKAASGLVEQLKRLRMQGVRTAMNGHEAMMQIRQLRLPARVHGNWRLRFHPDASGWEVKTYQLLAAQWAFTDAEGYTVLCGWPPVEPENRLQDRAREARARLAEARSRTAQRSV